MSSSKDFCNRFSASVEIRDDANIIQSSAYCTKSYSTNVRFRISVMYLLSTNETSTVPYGTPFFRFNHVIKNPFHINPFVAFIENVKNLQLPLPLPLPLPMIDFFLSKFLIIRFASIEIPTQCNFFLKYYVKSSRKLLKDPRKLHEKVFFQSISIHRFSLI